MCVQWQSFIFLCITTVHLFLGILVFRVTVERQPIHLCFCFQWCWGSLQIQLSSFCATFLVTFWRFWNSEGIRNLGSQSRGNIINSNTWHFCSQCATQLLVRAPPQLSPRELPVFHSAYRTPKQEHEKALAFHFMGATLAGQDFSSSYWFPTWAYMRAGHFLHGDWQLSRMP